MNTHCNSSLIVHINEGQSPKLVKEPLPVPSPGTGQAHASVVQSFGNNVFGDGAVLGCDFSTAYCLIDQRTSFKVPANLSRKQASTDPLAAATAWLAMFSPDNAKLVRSYGANQSNPNIYHVFGTAGNQRSSPTASRVFDNREGNVCTVRPGKAHTEGVTENTLVTDVLIWTPSLKDYRYGKFHWPGEDHDLASELFEKLGAWLEKGTIKPNTTKVLPGLSAVPNRFQGYRNRKISAYKIVYQI
ncbi:hypothetical protein BDV29DRAFT_190895 [Aspergillus leporis]|uniref:Uncharacterized protein n=1 Tax=Aspergillus leporis TaxID=41062 RepID=A0A5N5X3F7_9EURO|nr:hypothetical protein BDV29DRAFT_190895 [Aspergillus leporis]